MRGDVMEAMKSAVAAATTASLMPTPSPSHVTPQPSIIPTKPVIQVAGETGHRTLWVVFVLMLISTIVFASLAYPVPVQKRLFHVITTFITAFAALSYFAMASGDGSAFAHVALRHAQKEGTPDTVEHIYRQVFWVRYIDWTVTTPLLLLDLALLAGLSGANILVAIVADVIMILTGLFAAYGNESGQKWAYYTIACVAYLIVVYLLAVSGRRNAAARDGNTSNFYSSLGLFTLIIWTAYPIIWAIGDGARRMTVDGEIIAYAVLDILAKPVFGTWLLVTHRRVPSTNLHLDGVWSHGFGKREGTLRVGDDDDDGA